MQEARANARLALMLALGQIQQSMGPDQRISAPADQLTDNGGTSSSAAVGQRNWTGVYQSWSSTVTDRPNPTFLRWLTSGNPNDIDDVAYAKTALTASNRISLVGEGTVGKQTEGFVNAPVTTVRQANGRDARLAWWVGDQNLKAALMSPQEKVSTSIGATRQKLHAAPRTAVELVETASNKVPFKQAAGQEEHRAKVVSWQQSELIADDVDASKELFHDLTSQASGLLTNVRAAGFRKDLSLQLQLANASTSTPSTFVSTPLYSVNSDGRSVAGRGSAAEGYGINMGELATYYSLGDKLVRSSGTFTSGGSLPTLGALRSAGPTDTSDQWFYYKQPTIVSYQMIFSLQAFPDSAGVNILHLVCDPVVTLWNPYDVPLIIPQSSFLSVKYWQIPYDFYISGVKYPMVSSVGSDGDQNYFTLRIGNTGSQIVMKPGEVLKFSQTNATSTRPGRDIDAKVGFNFGGGIRTVLKTGFGGTSFTVTPLTNITFECRPNNLTAGKRNGTGNSLSGADAHSRHFSTTHHEVYVGFDREESGASLGFGNMTIDYDWGRKRLGLNQVRGANDVAAGAEKKTTRLYANNFPEVFPVIPGRSISGPQLIGSKSPVMIFGFNAKTENSSALGSKTLSRFNPKAHQVDFFDLSLQERHLLPYEIQVEPLSSWKNRSIEASANGQGYFGGGMTSEHGTNFVCTHSVPREPIISLAAFQHSMANGFIQLNPTDGYATLNSRDLLQPHVSHAIGNSMAPPILAPQAVSGTLSDGRPIADHSYLANRELWDSWFLSGLANYSTNTQFGNDEKKAMKTLCQEFLEGTSPLPCLRYLPRPHIDDPATTAGKLIGGSASRPTPTTVGLNTMASYIRVDGMFNINSTSVEAWKAQLGGLRNRSVVVRDQTGKESVSAVDTNSTPVSGLLTPLGVVTESGTGVAARSPNQWVGQRRLNDNDIDQLAQAIVREVRKRGPFLSLADFVNRRPGTDKNLAKSGAIQSALDSPDAGINATYSGRVSNSAAAFRNFPEADAGPMSYGIPGVVKQADILTPIAPILSARSDSFIIRSYGESVDGSGKVLARAWCEATVERSADYVDPTNAADVVISNASTLAPLTNTNKAFGRRCQVVSFRWLQQNEI